MKDIKLKENEVLRYKHKLHIDFEKIPYAKYIRPKKKTKYEKIFDEADNLRHSLVTNENIMSMKMIALRTDSVYNLPEFQKILNCGKKIRHHEIKCCTAYFVITAMTIIVAVTSALMLTNVIPMLFAIGIIALGLYIFNPRVSFRKFYHEIYLPICYYCANIKNDDKDLEFDVFDKKENWDKSSLNKKLVTNKFIVRTKNIKTVIEKMIVRNTITTYSTKRGKIVIGKKIATVFSGYSFDMNINDKKIKRSIKKNEDVNNINLALINKDIFYGTTGLSDEESMMLKKCGLTYRALSDWNMYVSDNVNLTKSRFNEIQKKTMMMRNEIGKFNAYVTGNSIRVMLGIQSNKDNIEEEFFKVSISNTDSLKFNAFFSIVKTLYIISCMKKMYVATYSERIKDIIDRR